MVIRHATASTFVFGRHRDGWRIGLIRHPLLRRLMIPGGHVEGDESPPEAALREVAEETGLRIRLVPAPGPAVPAELRSDSRLAGQPWWIMEQPIDRDNYVAGPHWHVDHLYVAVATAVDPVTAPAHPFGWHRQADLASLDMFDDARLLALALFADIDAITAGLADR